MSDITLEERTKEFLYNYFEKEAEFLYLEFCEKYKKTFTLVSWNKLPKIRKNFYLNKVLKLYLNNAY